MSRLTIEIDPQQHRQIKTLATFSGMTMKEFILAKTIGEATHATGRNSGDATADLMRSPENAKRLRQAIATPASEHLAFETIDHLKHALGI